MPDDSLNSWTLDDRKFAMQLIADARALGLAEIRFKDLTVRFAPRSDDSPQVPRPRASAWSATMPRFADPAAAYNASLTPKDL